MKYCEYLPSSELANFIKMFWTLEGETTYQHYSLADVCPELLFHYDGKFDEVFQNNKIEKTFTSGIHAQTSKPRKFTIDKPFGIFGISFYPHALPFLFNISAHELTDEMPDLKTLLGNEGNELEEKIFSAESHNERIQIIGNFIYKKLVKNFDTELPVFHCIRTIIGNKETKKVSELSDSCFLSERQFERQFQKYAGLTPKLFSRIVRFLSATNMYGGSVRSLTEIAYECGYYDQAHFIHDFKKFSGLHPKHFYSGKSGATDWRN